MHLHYDIAQRYRQRESEHDPVPLSPEIFRAYDIRGVIDKTLDSGVARKIGQAVGSLALERDAGPVVVARDGRLSPTYPYPIGRWQLDSWIVAIGLAAKLLLEQVTGPLPVTAELSGGRVIVDAHLYGAVAGCITGGSIAIRVRTLASI